MCGLPRANDHFAHTPHGLAVAAHHADGTEVVQDVFGGNRLAANAAFGKGQVFRNRGVEVMAHHEHVHMLVECVHRVRARGVGGAGQYIGLAHHFQNIGRMATTRTFGVESVDGAALESRHRVFHKARLVERVGVDGHLRVGGFGHVQTVVNRSGCGAPVFVQLQTNRACVDLLVQRIGQGGIAFAQGAEVHREGIGRLQHAFDVPSAGCASGGKGTGGRACAAAEHGGHATGQGFFNLLGRDEVDVRVHTARGDDVAFAADHLGAWANDDVHTRLCVGVARFANGHDAATFQTNVGFDNAPVVNDERIGHHGIHRATRLRAGACTVTRALRLRHTIADGFAAAKFHFFAVATRLQREVFFNLNHQVGVCQAQAVAHGGAKHFCVGAFADGCHYMFPLRGASTGPLTKPRKPNTWRSPLRSTNSTVRCWPGSKRTAVPDAMFRRMPCAATRSKRKPPLVSAKW